MRRPVVSGDLTPMEAGELTKIFQAFAKILETAELERRVFVREKFAMEHGSSGIGASKRALNENVAMLSDLFIFAALAAFVLADAISR